MKPKFKEEEVGRDFWCGKKIIQDKNRNERSLGKGSFL